MSPKKKPAKKVTRPANSGARGTKKSGTKKTGRSASSKRSAASKKSAAAKTKPSAKTGAKSTKSKGATKVKVGAPAKQAKKAKPAKKAAAVKSSGSKSATKKSAKKKSATKKSATKPAKKVAAKSTTKSKRAAVSPVGKKAASKRPGPAQPIDVNQETQADVETQPVVKTTITPEQMDRFHQRLRALRHRLIGDVNMMSEEAFGTGDGGGDNHAPIHPAEIGTHSFEQEFTLNLLSSDGDRLDLIEAALEKIADGTYGLCDECGGRIPKARLEVIPDTPYCVKCASKIES